jgi:tetratricopeptide (TPR) repeat protein
VKVHAIALVFFAGISGSLSFSGYGAGLATISGVVRDVDGKSVVGARVVLTDQQVPSDTRRTASGEAGEYAFHGLNMGEYSVAVELDGYLPAMPTVAHIVEKDIEVQVDFKLTRVVGSDPGSNHSETPLSAPKFEAAGVRGLIDAGGYSASANAAAASGLIKGMADIKRGEMAGAAGEKEYPCGLEPELKRSVEENPGSADANKKLGRFYLAHGQLSRAIPFLEAAHEKLPSDFETSRDLASAWTRDAQFESARKLLIALAERQDRPEVHTLLARADEGSGLFRGASEQYQIAANEEASEDSLFGVGYELILDGSVVEADKAFQTGLKKYPASTQLLIGAGTSAFLQGSTSAANLYFLRAADSDPVDPRPYAFLASTSKIQGPESDRVIQSLEKFLTVAPNDPEASYYYAVGLWNRRGSSGTGSADLDEIETLLKRAIQLNPDFAKAHFQLGTLYYEREQYQEAAREYETALRLAPELRDAHYRLANAYKHIGQSSLAAQEMSVFQATRDKQSSRVEGDVSIEQFISVIAPRGSQVSSHSLCSDSTP